MGKYRKKPVVIDAVLFDNSSECLCELSDLGMEKVRVSYGGAAPEIVIQTLEGEMRGQIGDYIIKGVNGEFYPCKPDIFEKTYDVADPERRFNENHFREVCADLDENVMDGERHIWTNADVIYLVNFIRFLKG